MPVTKQKNAHYEYKNIVTIGKEVMVRRKKVRSKKWDIAKSMPDLFHKLPNEEYDENKSEVLKWISEQKDLLNWLFQQLNANGYIVYNNETGKWKGANRD